MQRTPKGLRLHIAIFGRRNVGKSSVLNAITNQDVAIVSDAPGTTTDPVEKTMEMLPLGPVLFVDTAGFDDIGDLGRLRTRKTQEVLERTDIAILVTEADQWGDYERIWVEELGRRKIPTLVVLNKADLLVDCSVEAAVEESGLRSCRMSAFRRTGVLEVKQAVIETVPDYWYKQAGILDGIVHEGDVAIMVVPIDKEAPKGRLILPQVQTLRDILDKRAQALVTNEDYLPVMVDSLKIRPRLVITDAQVFDLVAQRTPPDVPMTSFSIAFARYKGDLATMVQGARRVETLTGRDRVLICEACTHHPIGDDIGRDKIPRWLRSRAGRGLTCKVVAGHDFPSDIDSYSLVIHCGACVFNRREMLSRIIKCQQMGVPITNYGICIAAIHGILDRALAAFELEIDFSRAEQR